MWMRTSVFWKRRENFSAETALTHLLTIALDRPALHDFFREMPTDGKTTKVRMIEELELLTSPVIHSSMD
jgi:hypothetical protein